MEILTNLVIGMIAALHLYFLWFEMFAWETTGRKIFRQMPAEIFPQTKVMALHGLAEYSQLSKKLLDTGLQFKDLFSSMFDMGAGDEEDDFDEDDN